MNGPSGIVLDEQYLTPLGYTREDAWLCDLLPETRLNPSQKQALERAYTPLVHQGIVPKVTIPEVPRHFCDETRAQAIADEILASEATVLVTLGDIPLREFIARYEQKWSKLSVFGQTENLYGQMHPITINGQSMSLLPLVHPRQAGRLGSSSNIWAALHERWLTRSIF